MQPKPSHNSAASSSGRTNSALLRRLSSRFMRRGVVCLATAALIALTLFTWRGASAAFVADTGQPTVGLGLPYLGSNAPKSAASNSKAGSVLFFPKYTSSSAQPEAVNTLLTLTNANPRDSVAVLLFFIHDCTVASRTVNLAPNQTQTLLASKELPDTTGYVMAVAINSFGIPAQFNWLLGSASVRDASGQEANYNAIAVAKRTAGPVPTFSGSQAVDLRFDNTEYDRLPKVVALDSVQNQDPNAGPALSTEVAVYSPHADLSLPALSQDPEFTAVAYDQVGRPYPKTFHAGCGWSSRIGEIWALPLPETASLDSFITPGRPGWATFSAKNPSNQAVPVFGLSLTTATDGAQHNARMMQALSWVDTYTIRVPISGPTAAASDPPTQPQPDAVGGALGASEMKAGSILLYPRFASGEFGATQINLTNTHPTQKARVRVSFTGLANTATVSETIITLLPNQTTSLQANDIAPNQRGWAMAVAIDNRALPIKFNSLIGSAQVTEAEGYVAAFNAIAMAKNSSGAVPRNADVLTADLLFNDAQFDRLPATVALNAAPSQADHATLLGYSRPAASLLETPNTRGAASLVLYDDAMTYRSATMGVTETRLSTIKSSVTAPPIANVILAGHKGWLYLQSGTPLFGWASHKALAPFTVAADGSWAGGLGGGGNLQILTVSDSFLIKAPAINPNNRPPTALSEPIGFYVEARHAGGTIVRLDASESSDPDPDDPLTYEWYDNDRLISTARIADYRMAIGTHIIRLVVTDGSGAVSLPDEQFVEVGDSLPPQISGVPSSITKTTIGAFGEIIVFPLPAAYDMVSGPISVTASKPPGSLFTIGKTTVTFTARDGAGKISTAKMDVTLTRGSTSSPMVGGKASDIAPRMDNLNDQYIPVGEIRNLTLQATDPDGDPVTFTLLGAPSFARLVNVDQAARRATLRIAPQAGDPVFTPSVVVALNDGRGQTFSTLPFRIVISDVPNDDTGSGSGGDDGDDGDGDDDGDDGDDGGGVPVNQPPTAAAAPLPATAQATSKEGAEVHLDGSASNDPDGDPLSYTWTENGQVIAEGALVDLKLPVGRHSIVLTVTDGKGGTNSAAPVTTEVLPRPLTVALVSPTKIQRNNNPATLSITGTGFNANTKVSFSGSGVTLASYVSIEEDKIVITVRTTTSTPLGNRDIFVTNPDGVTVRRWNAFQVSQSAF